MGTTPEHQLKPPTYLGDGLYAEDQGWQIRLFAANGITVTNEVFLDREMLAVLNVYAMTGGT